VVAAAGAAAPPDGAFDFQCAVADPPPDPLRLALAQPAIGAANAPADAGVEIDLLIGEGEAALEAGRVPAALAALRRATRAAERDGDPAQIAAAHGALAVALQAAGDLSAAREGLERSLAAARAAGLPAIEATTLNNLGNLIVFETDSEHFARVALERYDEAERLARGAGRAELAARSGLNAARLLVRLGDGGAGAGRLRQSLDLLQQAPEATGRAMELISAGLIARSLDEAGQPDARLLAHDLLIRAHSLAEDEGDTRARSYALGHLGALYMVEDRLEEALVLTRRALFLAQTANAPEVLYRWQWQSGRLLARQGEPELAIAAYQGAVGSLQSIRRDLPAFDPQTGRSVFRETVGPIYLELADLLLQRAGTDGRGVQADLFAARQVVEQLKTAELEDYFRDDCVALLQAQVRPLDQVEERSAALYPIILPDRLELLLSISDQLLRATVPVPAEELETEARMLRKAIVRFRDTQSYAQNLYRWLIAPFEAVLAEQQVDTLIFVPDGALRLIPLAVLHDGERYLVERLALATAPGLSLLDPRPISTTAIRPLLGGLTSEVQGFAPLPAVEQELESITRLYGGRVLKDEAFTQERLRAELEAAPYTVVHIASHAQFASDPNETFLLTHDGRITIDELERLVRLSEFRKEPVELIVLSACETAAGDDRAALGLAGIAIKAGARSAVATLWLVDDIAAARLTEEFYRNLGEPGLTRAQALQRAQITLLQAFRQPFLWAPFLLIGNWL
jgi:CHAT domain-containing protein